MMKKKWGNLLKKVKSIKINLLFIFFISFSSYSATVSSSINSVQNKLVMGNRGDSWSFARMPSYIYRDRGENINQIVLYRDQEMWASTNGYGGTSDITMTLSDENNGNYENRNFRWAWGRYGQPYDGVVVTQTSPNTWTIEGCRYSPVSTISGFMDILYTVSSTSLDGIKTMTNSLHVIHQGNQSGTNTARVTYRFFTYTSVLVDDIDFGTLVPNSNKSYEKNAEIKVSGGAGDTVNIGITADEGTVFGKSTWVKLQRAGGVETIPVEVSVRGSGDNIIGNLVLDGNGEATAYLKGKIPSYAMTPKLPKGRYNGTVKIEVTME